MDHTRKALAEFAQRPPEAQWRQLIAWGLINEKGEVRWNRHLDDHGQPVAPTDNGPAQ